MQMNKILIVLIVIVIIFAGLLPVDVHSEEVGKTGEERRIGHLFDLYMTESFVMLRDESLSERIKEIVNRIANAAELSGDNIRLRVINDELPVVSSFPGYVYLSSGMLDIIENESELAFIVAHAIAHSTAQDQHESYLSILKKERMVKLTGQIMPLIVFSGVGGMAMAGATTAAGSVLEAVVVAEAGVYSATAVAYALTDTDTYKNNIHNLFIPYLNLPDTKQSLSVIVFLSEIYAGYGREQEIQADNLAVSYLAKAGYDPHAAVPVLENLKNMRTDYMEDGNVFHLLQANPGLEKRIDNANHLLENYN